VITGASQATSISGRPARNVGIHQARIAARNSGDVFMTTDGKLVCYDVYGRSRGHVTVKGIGTNLCLAPKNDVYFTTRDALYVVTAE